MKEAKNRMQKYIMRCAYLSPLNMALPFQLKKTDKENSKEDDKLSKLKMLTGSKEEVKETKKEDIKEEKKEKKLSFSFGKKDEKKEKPVKEDKKKFLDIFKNIFKKKEEKREEKKKEVKKVKKKKAQTLTNVGLRDIIKKANKPKTEVKQEVIQTPQKTETGKKEIPEDIEEKMKNLGKEWEQKAQTETEITKPIISVEEKKEEEKKEPKTITCDRCGRVLEVPNSDFTTRIRCVCGKRIKVGGVEAEE